jgi:hypothetical protein
MKNATMKSIIALPFVQSLEKWADGSWVCVLKPGFKTDNGNGQGVIYENTLRNVASFLKDVATAK